MAVSRPPIVELTSVALLSSILGSTVVATEKNMASLRSLARVDVREFYSSEAAKEMRISEHCELAFLAIMTVLKFGLVEGAEEDAPVLQRLPSAAGVPGRGAGLSQPYASAHCHLSRDA